MSNFPLAPTGTEAAVCYDIAKRQLKGVTKYGVTVSDNPLPLRDWLQHAYEETLDKAVYLKRAIEEIEHQNLVANRSPKGEEIAHVSADRVAQTPTERWHTGT